MTCDATLIQQTIKYSFNHLFHSNMFAFLPNFAETPLNYSALLLLVVFFFLCNRRVIESNVNFSNKLFYSYAKDTQRQNAPQWNTLITYTEWIFHAELNAFFAVAFFCSRNTFSMVWWQCIITPIHLFVISFVLLFLFFFFFLICHQLK